MSARWIVPLLWALLLVAFPSPAAAAPAQATDTLAACAKRSAHLLVNIEIDGSRSLQNSDPEDRRVDGVSAALFGLANLVERPDWERPPPRVEVMFSSFAGSVQPQNPTRAWHRVNGSSREQLLSRAERYASRDHGRDTDYVLAFQAARSALNQRAAAVREEGGPVPCKVLLFFSDGGFRIGDRSGAQLPSTVPYAPEFDLERASAGAKAVAAGRRLLCRRDGLMDRIQADGITLFTVALTGPRFSALDRDRLAAMTTGEAGGVRCGSRLSESSGKFIEARDSRELFYAFQDLIDPEGEPVCPPRCQNPSWFRTESGMLGFVLSASAPEAGVELELTAPGGESMSFSQRGAGEVSSAGATIEQDWIYGRSMEIRAEFDLDDPAWVGDWRLRFLGPAETPVPTYDLTFLSGLRPEVIEKPQLRSGGTTTVDVHLVDPEGTPVTSGALVEESRLRAAVVDGVGALRQVEARRVRPGSFEVPVQVPADAGGGSWELRAETYFPDRVLDVEGSSVSLDLGVPKEPDGPPFPWWPIAVALLLSLGTAALIEYRHRRARALFIRPRRLLAFESKVQVLPGTRVGLDPDPGQLDYNDFDHLPLGEEDARVASIDQPPFALRARAPWRFMGGPFGVASAKDRFLLGGTPDGRLPGDEGEVRVPLELAGVWLFAFPPPAGEEVEGSLIVFTEDDAPSSLGSEVLEAARRSLLEQEWDAYRQEPEDDDDRTDLPDIDDDFNWASV